VSEGFMLTAIAYILATQHRPVFVAVAMAAVAGSFLVSYTRAKAEAIGLRGDVGIGSRAERVVVITAGLVLAPWGVLPWSLVLLAATAWVTVGQRVLHVRKQLMEASK
jgi:CDP-diacylglycerol--glycerol-3-phosphate 3-phosphatidyltransferase